jgi:hypothetical protein
MIKNTFDLDTPHKDCCAEEYGGYLIAGQLQAIMGERWSCQ